MSQREGFGSVLRELRKKRGVTEVELAKRVGMTQTSIWRYETGKRLPRPELLDQILEALEVSAEESEQIRRRLHEVVTELESSRTIARRGLGRRQEDIGQLEAEATQIRVFQAGVIPGLLQTPDYARNIFEGAARLGLETSPDEVGRALVARLDRQGILHTSSKRFSFVIAEAVLLWPRDDPEEMIAQIDRVQSISKLRNVDLRILPLGAPPPISPLNSFTVFDDALAYVETLTTVLTIREAADVALYVKAHKLFQAASASGPDADAILEAAAVRLR